MKKYLVPILYTLGIMLLGSFISSILYYFNITSDKFNTILLYLISIVAIFVGALKLGRSFDQKGMITGLIYFTIWLIIMILISLIFFKVDFGIKNIIYYAILLIFSMLGGIIGKNTKEETDAN